MKKAKSKILVLESADTIPSSTTIEKLCSKFKDSNIGIVGSRVIPKKNKNKIMNFTVQLQWILHHEISKDNPKFGELIAFRKIMKNIPLTAVDEEEIASVIKNKNFKTIYEPKAIVHNKGPETVKDFFRQRRRIYCGHLQLKKKMNYEASSLNTFKVLKKFIKLKQVRKNIFLSIIAVMLECFGRLLGLVDYYTNKNHVVWKVSESTKKLRWKF